MSKFTVFKDGYVKDWITDGPVGQAAPNYGAGNNRQTTTSAFGLNSYIGRKEDNTFPLFKEKPCFYLLCFALFVLLALLCLRFVALLCFPFCWGYNSL